MSEGPSARRKSPVATLVRRLLGDERVRFILVGGLNTVIGYSLFVTIQFVVGRYTSYYVSLYGSYFLATLIAFPIHRRFTFQVSGKESRFIEFLRFQGVNVIALGVNTVTLPLLVEFGHLIPILAQAVIVVATTLISYFGHKFFTFRRKMRPAADPEPEVGPAV